MRSVCFLLCLLMAAVLFSAGRVFPEDPPNTPRTLILTHCYTTCVEEKTMQTGLPAGVSFLQMVQAFCSGALDSKLAGDEWRLNNSLTTGATYCPRAAGDYGNILRDPGNSEIINSVVIDKELGEGSLSKAPR